MTYQQPTQQPTQQPIYILAQNRKRLLVPKITSFIVLGIIFYLGILLNVSLLNISANSETIVKLVALVLLIAVVGWGIFTNIKKSKQKYLFYHDRITFRKKQAILNEITNIQTKRNFLDKLFNTYSLNLTQKFKINNIPNNIQLQDYVQKLVSYSRGY